MSISVHLSSVRKKLLPRREPYWAAPVAGGRFVGFRKIDDNDGTWVARMRDDSGRKYYRSLGHVTTDFNFDKAKQEAGRWFRLRESGISDDVISVSDACRHYVQDRLREKGEATAHDAEMRFRRTIYDKPLGACPLAKLRAPHIKLWRHEIGLLPASSNRTLAVLKAALNLAVRNRQVSRQLQLEWRDVLPLKVTSSRRTLFLDIKQRRALVMHCRGRCRDLVEAAALTGARPGELVRSVRSQFDARTECMTFVGKTGSRTVPLSPAALALFERLAKSKLPNAWLFVRNDGKPWGHSDWDTLIREAAIAADLPDGVCLYTLRHSAITTWLSEGMPTLDVARLVGTSVVMIEKHYGHLVHSSARRRLAKVRIL